MVITYRRSSNQANSVYLDIPARYRKKICGMCGNFNGNQRDDMMNLDGKKVAKSLKEFLGWMKIKYKGDLSTVWVYTAKKSREYMSVIFSWNWDVASNCNVSSPLSNTCLSCRVSNFVTDVLATQGHGTRAAMILTYIFPEIFWFIHKIMHKDPFSIVISSKFLIPQIGSEFQCM